MKQDKYYIEYNDQEQSFDVYEVIAWHHNGSKQTAQTFCRCFDESDANQIIKTLNLTKDLPSKENELRERIQQLEENLRLSNSALINSRSHFEGLRFGNDRLQNAYHICLIQIASNEELLNNK